MMRRIVVLLSLGLVAGLWPATSGVAHGSTTTQAAPAQSLQADFNSDGADDLAVGVPLDNVGAVVGAGAVNVLYGSATGLTATGSQLFSQDTPGVPGTAEVDDGFGFSLATGDFNGDSFADLAVGAPGEGVGTADAAGAVNVLYGSATGLSGTGSQLFTQDPGGPEPGDEFGSALAAGNFNGDSFTDLAASAPQEGLMSSSQQQHGAFTVLPGSANGLTSTGGQFFSQNTPGVPGNASVGDQFAFALASGDFNGDSFADVAAGTPFEEVLGAFDAGVVNVLYGSTTGLSGTGSQLFTQVGGAVEAGDEFGFSLATGDFNNDTFADLAAGAPREGLGSNNQHGAFSVLPGSANGLTGTGGQLFSQNTPGVPGNASVGDQFAFALASGDFNGDSFADVAAGTPFEEVLGAFDAGVVNVLYGSTTGLSGTGSQLFTQVGGAVEPGDGFGFALASGNFNSDTFADLAAGAPFEQVGSVAEAGAVSALPGSANGLTGTGGQLFSQASPGVPGSAQEFDLFGFTLATGDPGPAATTASAASASGPSSRTRRTAPVG